MLFDALFDVWVDPDSLRLTAKAVHSGRASADLIGRAIAPMPRGRAADRWVLSVQSPTLRTAGAFLATATDCGLYDADPRDAVVRRREGRPLIPWRVFATVYELRVPLRGSFGVVPYDQVEYDRRHVWWRTIAELARSVAASRL